MSELLKAIIYDAFSTSFHNNPRRTTFIRYSNTTQNLQTKGHAVLKRNYTLELDI